MPEQNTGKTGIEESTNSQILHAFAQHFRTTDDPSLGLNEFLKKCPRCKIRFDVRLIGKRLEVGFVGRKIQLSLFFCPECVRKTSHLSGKELRGKLDEAFQNVNTSEDSTEWAATTDLTVWSHGGDEVSAIVYGCHFSRDTIKDYDSGDLELGLVIGVEGVGHE